MYRRSLAALAWLAFSSRRLLPARARFQYHSATGDARHPRQNLFLRPRGAVEAAKRMEQELPNHPLGYLLEAEALWWRIWCTSADFKYGMSDARAAQARSGPALF